MGPHQSVISRRLAIVAGCVLLALTVSAQAPDTHQKRVLVFTALRKDAPIPTNIDRDFQRILGGIPGGIDYYSESIDLARFPEPDYQAALRDFLSAEVLRPAVRCSCRGERGLSLLRREQSRGSIPGRPNRVRRRTVTTAPPQLDGGVHGPGPRWHDCARAAAAARRAAGLRRERRVGQRQVLRKPRAHPARRVQEEPGGHLPLRPPDYRARAPALDAAAALPRLPPRAHAGWRRAQLSPDRSARPRRGCRERAGVQLHGNLDG